MSGASTWLEGEIVSADAATPGGRILHVHVPGWPGNVAGQHIDVRLTAEDGYQASRSYSLASSGPDPVLELAVDEVPDGEVSPYLVRDVEVGDRLEVRGPIGTYFVWTPDVVDPVQLVAGGSGIVPLMAMVRAHADAASATPMRLLYSVRSPADAFYAAELDALAGDGFSLAWAYTRVAAPGALRPAGRVDAATLAAVTIAPDRAPLVFVCGPTRFVEVVADLLVAAGHPPHRVRTERFGGA